jgi:transcriptional regulator with XRE-family HTH domain
MEPGRWIRALREERQIKPSDVERIARRIADAKGNPDFYISHSTLADIETGSVPSIHKLFTLSHSLKVPLNELLLPFGIDSEQVSISEAALGRDAAVSEVQAWPGKRLLLESSPGTDTVNGQTTLLKLQPQDLAMFPGSIEGRLDPLRYRYGLIGANDDIMADLLPPGSLVEIDTRQNSVEVFRWRTPRERPLYLVWHASGHSCCWCQVEGRELILVPHPLSQHLIRRFKMPGQANIIGRVTNAWLHFEPRPSPEELLPRLD